MAPVHERADEEIHGVTSDAPPRAREDDAPAFPSDDLDGASGPGSRISLPLAMPSVIATGIFVFMIAWNEFLFALLFLVERRDRWTVSLGLAQLSGSVEVPTTVLMAGSVVITLPVVLLMLEAVRDHYLETGRQVGVKAAGGIRTGKDALRYLVLVAETAGDLWLQPQWFRFGASSLLNDVLMQLEKERTARYQRPTDFPAD